MSEQKAPFNGLIGMAEIAAHLRVSKPKVRDFISQGMPICREGRAVYAHPSNIDDWFKGWTNRHYRDPGPDDDV